MKTKRIDKMSSIKNDVKTKSEFKKNFKQDLIIVRDKCLKRFHNNKRRTFLKEQLFSELHG